MPAYEVPGDRDAYHQSDAGDSICAHGDEAASYQSACYSHSSADDAAALVHTMKLTPAIFSRGMEVWPCLATSTAKAAGSTEVTLAFMLDPSFISTVTDLPVIAADKSAQRRLSGEESA